MGEASHAQDNLTANSRLTDRVDCPRELIFFALALTLYLITRLVRLPDFPIYFFTDEAVQTILAQDFVRDGLHGYDHQFLPTFFPNGSQYNLGVSVYLQVLPYLLFGKSVWVTRGVSVLVTLLAVAAAGLILKNVFHSAYYWVATLFLSITPAWFLHSRTAFETAVATSFYAAFLYCYLMYRTRSGRAAGGYLGAAVVMGALMFYSYSPTQMTICVTGLLLFFSDLPYHWKNRRIVLFNAILLLVLTIPLIRFQMTHPNEFGNHLAQLHSYWVERISTVEKMGHYFTEYARGLDPRYWFIPNDTDLPRHLMKNYAHVLPAVLPFLALGLAVVVVKFRSAPHRALLLAILAAPSGAALAAVGITRVLTMVVPLAVVSGLGLSVGLDWLQKRLKFHPLVAALPVFGLMAGVNVWMLTDALTNGPLWFDNYGLGGMQYGANQIFAAIDTFAAEYPDDRIIVSPSWANGTDVIARFYYPNDDRMPFELGSIDGYIDRKQPLEANTTFVMIPEELERVIACKKFTHVKILEVVRYPNGESGFYFVRLSYVDDIDTIFDQEKAARRILQEAEVVIDGKPAAVHYSYLDLGEIKNIFDDDPTSLLRSFEANPLEVQIEFSEPRSLGGLDVKVGGTPTEVKVKLYNTGGVLLLEDARTVAEDPNPRAVRFEWNPGQTVGRVDISVRNVYDQEPAHVHLWQISFRDP
jgi:hypothetical protein